MFTLHLTQNTRNLAYSFFLKIHELLNKSKPEKDAHEISIVKQGEGEEESLKDSFKRFKNQKKLNFSKKVTVPVERTYEKTEGESPEKSIEPLNKEVTVFDEELYGNHLMLL